MTQIHIDNRNGYPSSALDILQLLQIPVADPQAARQTPATLRRLHAGDTLFLEGTQAQAIYVVRGGCFKISCSSEDGYEQVLAFTERGDVLGLDGWCGGLHANSAVALEDCSVFGLALPDVTPLARRLPEFDQLLHRAAAAAVRSRTRLIDVMAAVSAEVRLARFLVQWSQRMQACGESPTRLLLRMCRRDLASHLGVAHATVSRSFSALADWGLLQVANRDVEILDLDGLRVYARSTRRPSDESPGMARAPLAARALRAQKPAGSTVLRPAAAAWR